MTKKYCSNKKIKTTNCKDKKVFYYRNIEDSGPPSTHPPKDQDKKFLLEIHGDKPTTKGEYIEAHFDLFSESSWKKRDKADSRIEYVVSSLIDQYSNEQQIRIQERFTMYFGSSFATVLPKNFNLEKVIKDSWFTDGKIKWVITNSSDDLKQYKNVIIRYYTNKNTGYQWRKVTLK